MREIDEFGSADSLFSSCVYVENQEKEYSHTCYPNKHKQTPSNPRYPNLILCHDFSMYTIPLCLYKTHKYFLTQSITKLQWQLWTQENRTTWKCWLLMLCITISLSSLSSLHKMYNTFECRIERVALRFRILVSIFNSRIELTITRNYSTSVPRTWTRE